MDGCNYTVTLKAGKPCPKHPKHELQAINNCPVELTYLYPPNPSTDNRRWIGGMLRNIHEGNRYEDSLHSHPMPGPSRISSYIKDKIQTAATMDETLTATQVQQGIGLGFVPASADFAAAHVGRVRLEMKKARSAESQGLQSIFEFEAVADSIDANDNSHSGSTQTAREYSQLGRPYMREAGICKGIKFALLQSPFMSQQLSKASFIECDITYLEHVEYKYLFNITALEEDAMNWIIVGRCLLSKDDGDGYGIGFSKIFGMARGDCSSFEVGKTLRGIVIDWSNAEASGLQKAVRNTMANGLLRGSQVHWARSSQRVADKVCSIAEEKRAFNQ